MIVDLILGLLTDGINFLLGLLPAIALPSWMGPTGTVVTQAQSLGTSASGFGAWLPFSAVGTVLTVIIAAVPVCVGIIVVRRVISTVTGGGGAT